MNDENQGGPNQNKGQPPHAQKPEDQVVNPQQGGQEGQAAPDQPVYEQPVTAEQPVMSDMPADDLGGDQYGEDEFGAEEFQDQGFQSEEFPAEEFPAEDFGGEEFDDLGSEAGAYYEEDFVGDDEFGDAEWEDGDDAGGNGPTDEERKRKSQRFNQIVIGVAVILGAFVVYNTLLGGGAPVTQNASTNTAAIAPQEQAQQDMIPERTSSRTPMEESPVEESAPPSDSDSVQGMLHNPDLLDRMVEALDGEPDGLVDESLPMPTPMVTEPVKDIRPLTPMPKEMTVQGAAKEIAVVEDFDAPEMPEEMFEEVTEAQPQAEIVEAAPVAVAPVPAPASASIQPQKVIDNAALEDLNRKLDLLFNRLEQMEGQLEKAQKSSAPTPVASTVNNKEVKALKDTVRRLEGQVKKLSTEQARAVAQPAAPARVSVPVSAPTPVATPKYVPAKPVNIQAVQERDIESPKAVAVASPSMESTPSASGHSMNWVLKAAQPGEAYVARRGQQEMFHVTVGDELYGIGRVVSVRQQNGMWIVQGTDGAIRQ
jgi:hypothetical protein